MIEFKWNNILVAITDVGGGVLSENIPRHAHSRDSYELHFIVDGFGKLVTDDNGYDLKCGDFYVTGPNIYHEQFTNPDNPVRDIFVMLQVKNRDKANALSQELLSNDFCYINDFDCSVATAILNEYKNKLPDYQSAIAGLAMKLLTDITRRLLPDNFTQIVSCDNLYDKRFVIIENAFLYSDDLTLGELSDKIGLCERQTQRLLKKYYGKTFREKKKEKITAKGYYS
jgi:mannose-6-phosphate isomerase-like protein (cupin superfamily)/AraC-like DNA-binding protein